MAKGGSTSPPSSSGRGAPPPLTPEARENQLIALAMDVAERQMREGTASSQVITHFLKLGSSKYEYEMAKLKSDTELATTKAANLRAMEQKDEMFKKAIEAMRVYQGAGGGPNEY